MVNRQGLFSTEHLTLIFVTTFFLTSNAYPISTYEGNWIVNQEETEALREPYKDNSKKKRSKFKPHVSVGGLPMPGSNRQKAMSRLAAQSPMVLRSSKMTITFEGDQINVRYPNIGHEILHKGEFRGRKTKWSRKQIKQTYRTTERRVTKTWSINKQGRLLVIVKIKPNEAKQVITRRVFDPDSLH